MGLTVSIDATKTPLRMTVTSDRRKVPVIIKMAGETALGTAQFPVTIVDSSGRAWSPVSDDGLTAVYTG